MENKSPTRSLNSGLRLIFSGAHLHPSTPVKSGYPKFRIGWYIKGTDVNTASTRYRSFHFARILENEFENFFYSRLEDIKKNVKDLDALIIVKRLDKNTIELASLARYLNKPLFLDLCDDIANPKDTSLDRPYYALTALLAMAPSLRGITVPSAEMAARVDQHLSSNGFTRQITHVIPDIAETRNIFLETEIFVQKYFGKATTDRHTKISPKKKTSNIKQIIWFGNFGGSHSNFGLFTLKPFLKSLKSFHSTQPIELVIVSNNIAAYEALFNNCGFPTRYVPWSSSAVYDELERSDVALLTTGTDEFCTVKSSNRVLQALAASVPVITDKSPALAEFEEVIFPGKFQQSLEDCLSPGRENTVAERMALAAPILQRYSPERLAAIWATLLKNAIGQTLKQRAEASRKGMLLILSAGDPPALADAAVQTLNQAAGRTSGLLVCTSILTDKTFQRIIKRSHALPMFFSEKLAGLEAQFLGWSCIAVGNLDSANGKLVRSVAAKLGIDVILHEEVSLDRVESTKPLTPTTSVPLPPPGPYAQRSNPDGSLDWAFVIHNKARGWILDAICQEIGSRQPASWSVVEETAPPPPARNLFFSHISLLDFFEKNHPESIEGKNILVWYTHPRDEDEKYIARNLDILRKTTFTIFTCEANRKLWLKRGLDEGRTRVVLGGADPNLFTRHERGGGVIGLSSSFYERKNPDLLLNLVKSMPHRNFLLLGKNWNRYARFEELRALPNFKYETASYKDYPRIYSTFDVFLSISKLEGGPIPLIEAMMTNAVPVASHTGFAPDLITHGHNGFLFDSQARMEDVMTLIEQAFALTTDVRATVEQYSWDRFSAEIVSLGV